jgi:hypothetical protein
MKRSCNIAAEKPLDLSRPVRVHVHLATKRWAISQGGVVCRYLDSNGSLMLREVLFETSDASYDRWIVRRIAAGLPPRRKPSFAWATGWIVDDPDEAAKARALDATPVAYNPHRSRRFHVDGSTVDEVHSAEYATFAPGAICTAYGAS